ncbi:hypothetical protein GOODEAATRI_032796, partial [Goodea atripinnis]
RGSEGKRLTNSSCRICLCFLSNPVLPCLSCQAMRKIYKASLKYPEWKRKHNPTLKPWMYPEQNTLPSVSLADLTLQRADSLENIDESGVREEKAQHSDDEET